MNTTTRILVSLASWAAMGFLCADGQDEKWWSLRPVSKPAVPVADDSGWCKNEIDRFVLAKLTDHHLTPSPEAEPRTLIRRLSYDLTGLPPANEEIAAFIDNYRRDPETTWEKTIDSLLASPRYGEQWARHWLDVARYGESHGYDKDKARFNAWPYRDYVIRSFNGDKPWSRFVREQIAGDILWPGTEDGIVALGFLAAGPWDFIAHVEVGESKVDGRIAKHLDRDDMVSATFNAFMSTTAQCAQCHDHKSDPVSMEDYYRLHAVFAGVDRANRPYGVAPDFAQKRSQLEAEIAELEASRKAIAKAINERGGEKLKRMRNDVAALEKAKNAGVKSVPEHGYHSTIVPSPGEEKWVQIELDPEKPISEIRVVGCYDDYAGIGAGFGFPLRFKVEAAYDAKFSGNVRALADFTSEDFANPGLQPVSFATGNLRARFIRITATKLAERKGDYIFALAEFEAIGKGGANLALSAKVTAKDSIEAPNRWRRFNLTDGKFATAADPGLAEKFEVRRKELRRKITELGTPQTNRRRAEIDKRLASARKKLNALSPERLVFSIASHFKADGKFKPTGGNVRPIHLLHRGDIRLPKNKMRAGAPTLWNAKTSFDLPENHTEGERRAALAKYLTAKDNPLVWRSAVNRIWLYHMGRGIVDSPNDFGRMGAVPTHPKLLDWMAAHFRDDAKESVKAIHRLILTSATYRQSSRIDPNKSKMDGGNTYYWRMNSRKLRAEELRDSVLAVSGALNLKMGGPSFRDFKFKDDHTPKFYYDRHDPNDPSSHRRTIYRFIARSQTHPFLTTLDCADPSQMVAKRDETTTPLQALSLMNNPFMLAMSKKLAARAKSFDEPVSAAFRLALGRYPDPDEHKTLSSYTKKHGLPATCRLLLNLNEFVYVD